MIWIVCAVAVLVLFLLLMAKKKSAQNSDQDYPYRKFPVLFTPAERSFFGVLDQAAGKDFRLFGKVRVADVLAPSAGMSKSAWQTAFNKINRKHFDFVLCAPGDLSVLCAIELDDKSHKQKDRQDRDEFLQGACRAAGVPLISFQAQHSYSASEVSAKIASVLSGTSTHIATPVEIAESAETMACPRCSSPMIKRTAKGGENAGREFWGCSNFPNCREIVSI